MMAAVAHIDAVMDHGALLAAVAQTVADIAHMGTADTVASMVSAMVSAMAHKVAAIAYMVAAMAHVVAAMAQVTEQTLAAVAHMVAAMAHMDAAEALTKFDQNCVQSIDFEPLQTTRQDKTKTRQVWLTHVLSFFLSLSVYVSLSLSLYIYFWMSSHVESFGEL